MPLPENSPSALLVIPCYGEHLRLGRFLPDLLTSLSTLEQRVEVLVVDDGSPRESAQALEQLVEQHRAAFPFLRSPLLLPENLGKGGAIFRGWEHAGSAEWLGFADADGATSAAEVTRLLQVALHSPHLDGVFGSRILMLGKTVDRSTKRHFIGRAYATFTTLFTGHEVYDSQCGCKFLRNSTFQKIRPSLQEKRFGFDIELIAFALRSGAKLEEFPVDWQDVPGSKVHVLRDGMQMFASLWKLRKRLLSAPKED